MNSLCKNSKKFQKFLNFFGMPGLMPMTRSYKYWQTIFDFPIAHEEKTHCDPIRNYIMGPGLTSTKELCDWPPPSDQTSTGEKICEINRKAFKGEIYLLIEWIVLSLAIMHGHSRATCINMYHQKMYLALPRIWGHKQVQEFLVHGDTCKQYSCLG